MLFGVNCWLIPVIVFDILMLVIKQIRCGCHSPASLLGGGTGAGGGLGIQPHYNLRFVVPIL